MRDQLPISGYGYSHADQDHGHIKFWSISNLGGLLNEAGFSNIRFQRVGRIPALAKSMIAVAEKPLE